MKIDFSPRLQMIPGFGITELAGGLISGISGLIQKGKANKMLKNLQYPTEQLPQEFEENKILSQQMAGEGMPSEQYNQAMRNIQRQQLAAIRYAQDRRAGAGLIPTIQQNSNDAFLNLDAANAAQRIQNQRNLIGYNNFYGGQKRDIFDRNVRDKYNFDRDYAYSLKGAGNQNFVGGLDKLATGGLTAFGGMGNYGSNYKSQPFTMNSYDFEQD